MECIARCGISVGTQPTNEQVPRVAGNAFPSSFANSGTTTATSAAASTANATNQSREVKGGNSSDDAIRLGSGISSSQNAPGEDATVTTLAVIVALMGTGYVIIAVLFCLHRRRVAGVEKRRHAEWVSSMTETAALNSTFHKYSGDE